MAGSQACILRNRERFLGVYSSSIDARREFNSIFRLRRADGIPMGAMHWSPAFCGRCLSGYTGSCVDVADQKLVEEQLRANEARLKDAQRLAKVGSWERHIADNSIYNASDSWFAERPSSGLSSIPEPRPPQRPGNDH
jgi:hypothetical protein